MDGRTNNGNVSPSPPRFLLSFSHSIVVGSLFLRLAVLHFIILDSHRAPRSLRSVGRSVGGLISFIFGSHRSNAQRRAKK